MVNIHEYLKNGGMNVPEIILNKENQGYSLFEDGKYCVIYSFLNGEEIGNLFKNINKDISIKIAKEIKKIHQINIICHCYHLKSTKYLIDIQCYILI